MGSNFSKLSRDLFTPISCGPSEIEFLRQLRHAGGCYSEFSKIVENSHLLENLLRAARKLAGDRVVEPIRSAEVAMGTMGFEQARNYLAASIIQRKRTDLLPGHPEISGILKFALMSEARSRPEGAPPEAHFVAGLAFDFLRGLVRIPDERATQTMAAAKPAKKPSQEQPAEPPSQITKVPDPIEEDLLAIWAHGLEVAEVARQLAATLAPIHGLGDDLLIDGIVHDIGKAVYAVIAPEEYRAFQKADPPKRMLEAGRLAEEGFSLPPHDATGHLFLWRLGYLKDTAWMTMYHHQPFLARRLSRDFRARASLLWLADWLCRYRASHGGKISDPVIGKLHACASSDLGSVSIEKFSELVKALRFIEVDPS